jgi:hypothetical protein
MPLRTEVMRFTREDGGVDLVDLLLERFVSLTADEALALEQADPALMQRLEGLLLCEGTIADLLRRSAWSARTHGRPLVPTAPHRPGDWEEARTLPPQVAPEWSHPERYRRLAEEHAAGRRYLSLPGFLAPSAAARLAAEAAALPFDRLSTDYAYAERRLLEGNELSEWRDLMASPAIRRLFGAVLAAELPERVSMNVWRLSRGDFMGVHPDGRRYRGTLSLGLSDGWAAADGGAIAFGDPTPEGFRVRERWLPHLGDALLFAPSHDTWHAVEPVVTARTRLSVTGWWTMAV